MKVRTLVTAFSVLLVACGADSTGRSTITAAPPPETTTTSAPPPTTPGQVAAVVDRGRHVVPLEDVHFDTFGQGPLSLAEATDLQIASLVDAIPPLTAPRYDTAVAGDWLAPDALVIGYRSEAGGAYAYPHIILNSHEIVNDVIDDVPILISYCPLCRSGVVYNRRMDDRVLDFGNTSALYQNDLVMLDHNTNSYWWQVAGRAIVGELSGEVLTALPSITATWADWVALHPDTQILSRDTGFGQTFTNDAFAGYEAPVDAGRTPFPVDPAHFGDRRLTPGTRIIAVEMGDEAIAVAVGAHPGSALALDFENEPVVVFVDKSGQTAGAYLASLDGEALQFEPVAGLEGHFIDGAATTWDTAGRAVGGPLAGRQLTAVPSRSTFWFAYVAVRPDVAVLEVDTN